MLKKLWNLRGCFYVKYELLYYVITKINVTEKYIYILFWAIQKINKYKNYKTPLSLISEKCTIHIYKWSFK